MKAHLSESKARTAHELLCIRANKHADTHANYKGYLGGSRYNRVAAVRNYVPGQDEGA